MIYRYLKVNINIGGCIDIYFKNLTEMSNFNFTYICLYMLWQIAALKSSLKAHFWYMTVYNKQNFILFLGLFYTIRFLNRYRNLNWMCFSLILFIEKHTNVFGAIVYYKSSNIRKQFRWCDFWFPFSLSIVSKNKTVCIQNDFSVKWKQYGTFPWGYK